MVKDKEQKSRNYTSFAEGEKKIIVANGKAFGMGWISILTVCIMWSPSSTFVDYIQEITVQPVIRTFLVCGKDGL